MKLLTFSALGLGVGLVMVAALVACSPAGSETRGGGGSGTAGGAGGGNGGAAGSAGSVSTAGIAGASAGAGGVAGSASTAGAAGASAGTAAAGGGGGSAGGAGVGCTGTELFCEDFEDDTVGEMPASPWIPISDSCQHATTFSSEVTGDLKNTGSKSFKMTNHSNAECRISARFANTSDYWVRAFIYWEEAVSFENKEIMAIDIHGTSGLHIDGPTIRFGTRTKEPCTATPGPQITLMAVASGEQTGCSNAVAEPKGKWFCFEAHVIQGSTVSVKTFIDRAEFSYASSGKAATPTIDTTGPAVEPMDHLRLGFFTYNSSGKGSVYVDDVAVSTTRLNCGK